MSFTRLFYDPRYSMEDFDHLMDDVFELHSPHRHAVRRCHNVTKPFTPRMDVHNNDESDQVTAIFELPGIKKSDVIIDVHNDTLVISGNAPISYGLDEEDFQIRERRYGKFTRSLALPKGTEASDVNATMEDGLLSITYPKVHPAHTPARVLVD